MQLNENYDKNIFLWDVALVLHVIPKRFAKCANDRYYIFQTKEFKHSPLSLAGGKQLPRDCYSLKSIGERLKL